MSRRKKKRRKRKKSKSKDSALETEEMMDELEDPSEAPDDFNPMTAINRFYLSEEPTGVLDDGRCRECLMDCGKTRSHSMNKPTDFRFYLREMELYWKMFFKKNISVLFSKMTSR